MLKQQLINKGVSFIGNFDEFSKYKEKTLIVVGVARGGTSMVAGTLHHLGVFTGLKSASPVFEDIYLSSAIESKNFTQVKQIINEYNEKYKVWAFKRPSIINYLPELHGMFRNPIYLFIFKDLAAIAARNNISMKMEFIENLIKAQKDYQKIINFIQNNQNLNGLVFSYDKVIRYKVNFINILSKLINIDISNEKFEKIKKFITPNPIEYLDKARITKGKGNVDFIAHNRVSGWASYLYNSKSPKVELFINGKKVAEVEAKNFRKDLKDKGIHPTGNCGFNFVLPKNTITKKDEIAVKISDDIDFLPLGKKAIEFFN